jgi:hypothetical protein
MKARKLSLFELTDIQGYDDIDDFIETMMGEDVVPACCEHGCEVEPDGVCPHGNPSCLVEAKVI